MSRKPTKSRKKKRFEKGLITVYLPVSLIDQVKNVVYWALGLTIASFAEKTISLKCNNNIVILMLCVVLLFN